MNIDKLYKINDLVSTNKPIKGWFDYSLKTEIPSNTCGKIVKYITNSPDLMYEVFFNREFGSVNIKHSDLK